MLRRTILGLVFSAVSFGAMAQAPGGPDCGWGNMIFDGQSGFPAHFFGSWTNGTSGNATFGMTSGTNGCGTSSKLTYGGKKWMGMSAAMMSEFSEDVARGNGDAMKAVAVSMGVEQQDRAKFAEVMHSNFNNIFTSPSVTSEEVVSNILAVMKSDSTLSKYAV